MTFFDCKIKLKQQPQIILLKEGTDASQGRGQLLSNINACLAVVDTIRTTLGPRGMDKLIVDEKGFHSFTFYDYIYICMIFFFKTF